MSRETMEWLNSMTLIGFALKRGKAWHYKAELQGNEPNHYEGAIPVEDAIRRLYDFEVEPKPIFICVDGSYVQVEGRKAMVTNDNHSTLGVFKEGYEGHGYKPWLLELASKIVGQELGLGSCGLLKNRAQAWAQFELPDNVKTKEGVEFRPNLLMATSFDGSLATTGKRTRTIAVCDNTVEACLGEHGQQFKVKHTKYSGFKMNTAREALCLIHEDAELFAAEIEKLCQWEITARQWQQFLDEFVPVPTAEQVKASKSTRGHTLAVGKRDKLNELYLTDQRCAPWLNTAFGVLQAVNTYNHHEGLIRGGVHRAVRNMENVVSGKFAQADNDALSLLAKIAA
jgi:phage/plasmid-like protein (TIGR03299 family)